MTPRERILAAIDRTSVDRIPADYWGTDEVTAALMRHFGVSDASQLWRKLNIDKIINVGPQHTGPVLDGGDGSRRDYWGVGYKPQPYGSGAGACDGVYYEMCHHPIGHLKTIEEIKAAYEWPRADWFDFSGVARECDKYPDYAIEAGYIAPFYMFNNIRGLEQSLIDLAADEELSRYIIDKVCSFLYDYHERLFEAGRGRIDITQVTDDFGSQTGLLISIDMFRKYFKPHYKRFIKLARDFGIKVFHHDDGAMRPLIPELIELGIDILNPIQSTCPGMDRSELKREFGGRLCFHGGVDNQKVLPFGTVDEVRQEVIDCLDQLGSDGTGYILAPCHNIQPNTPIENILAMYEVAHEYFRGA